MDFEKVEEWLGSIDPGFRNLMIFNLLVKGKLKYEDLSKQYVRYLEERDKDGRDLIAELATSLVQHRNPKMVGGATKADRKAFMDEKAIKAIRRTRLFP